MDNYSVLLLYPDHMAENFGQDTYLTHVNARNPRHAIEVAREQVRAQDVDPADFHPLLVCRGWIEDIKP